MMPACLPLRTLPRLLAACACVFALHAECLAQDAKIHVALGMDYRNVEKNSLPAIQFPVLKNSLSPSFVKAFPHELHYIHPKRGFVLPGMGDLVLVADKQGRINSINDRPADSPLTLDDALALCERHTKIIDKAGWPREKKPSSKLYSQDADKSFTSFDEVRNAYLNPPGKPMDRVRIATWRDGSRAISIRLERRDTLFSEKAYTVTLDIVEMKL